MYSESELARRIKDALKDNIKVGNSSQSASPGQQIWVNVNGENIRGVARNNITPGQKVSVFTDDNGVHIIHANEDEPSDEFPVRDRRHRERPIEEQTTSKGAIVFAQKASAKGSIVFSDTTPAYGNVAILFHKVHRRQGQHPQELCPCDRTVNFDYGGSSNSPGICREGCGDIREFNTVQECNDEIARRLAGDRRNFYHTTYIGERQSDYTGFIPPSTATRLGYDLAADGNMYIVKPKSPINGKIIGYSYTFQKFYYIDPSFNQIYLNWWEVELYYAGVQLLYFDIASNTIQQTYGWINTKREMFGHPSNFPTAGEANGQILGSVFQESFQRHYTYPRFNPDDPIVSPPPTGSPWNAVVSPYFEYWGQIKSWLTETVNVPGGGVNPGGSGDGTPEDYEGNHYIITYYLGGYTSPAQKLGEYLYADPQAIYGFQNAPFDTDVKYGTAFIESGYSGSGNGVLSGNISETANINPEAFVSVIGEGQYEVVISYGGFKQLKTFLGNNVVARKYSIYWCAKDVYRLGRGYNNYKKTYKYPESPDIHPNNWMRNFLASWVIIDWAESTTYPYYSSTSNSRIKMYDVNSALRSEYHFGLTDPEKAYYLAWTTNRAYDYAGLSIPTYTSANEGDSYGNLGETPINGADAGCVNINPYCVGGMGVNFIAKEGDILYATDVDGHQFVSAGDTRGEFVDLIKSHDIENFFIKGGQIEIGFYEKRVRENNESIERPPTGIYPVQTNGFYLVNLVFNEQRSGRVTVNKCFSLGHPICRIKQMAAYVPVEQLKQNLPPIYGYIIKAPICFVDSEGYYEYTESITFSSKHTYKNLFKFFTIDPYYQGTLYPSSYMIPRSNLQTPEDRTKNFITTRFGWRQLNYYGSGDYHPYNSTLTPSQSLFPMQFKDCNNNLVRSLEWRNGYYGMVINLGSSGRSQTPRFAIQSNYFGGQILDICTNE